MPHSPLLEPLVSAIDQADEFSEGATKAASFIKRIEESLEPAELFLELLQANLPDKWMEKFLFCILHTGQSDIQTASRALELARTRRLLMRARQRCRQTHAETALANAVLKQLPIERMGDLYSLASRCRRSMDKLMEGLPIEPEERRFLVFLIRVEAKALKERVNWVTENIDPYNMKAMGRVLPRLRLHDENIQDAMELAKRIEKGETVGARILTFIQELREPVYQKMIKGMGRKEELKRFVTLLEAQRMKVAAVPDLVALSTLCRWTRESLSRPGKPLDWVLQALECYSEGAFSVPAGASLSRLAPLVKSGGGKVNQGCFEGHFHQSSFPSWIGRDLLTKSLHEEADLEPPDFRSLVRGNITRDGILEKLLDNPKVLSSPGLVGYIALLSRSISVLSKIASHRQLYAGHGNSDVPLALLQNPTRVPLSLLRPFINTRYVNMVDLRSMAKRRTGMRPEVHSEIVSYVKSREG